MIVFVFFSLFPHPLLQPQYEYTRMLLFVALSTKNMQERFCFMLGLKPKL